MTLILYLPFCLLAILFTVYKMEIRLWVIDFWFGRWILGKQGATPLVAINVPWENICTDLKGYFHISKEIMSFLDSRLKN